MKVVAEIIYGATTLSKAVDHETKPGQQLYLLSATLIRENEWLICVWLERLFVCHLLLGTVKVRACDTVVVSTHPLVAHPELSLAEPGVLFYSTDSLTERVHIDILYQIDCF